MDHKEILRHVDHTILAVTTTWEQVKHLCDEAIRYQTASVCIPASWLKRAADYVDGRVKVCTVIGFPNGYSTTAVKVFETEDAIRNGADEIDMVLNLGWAKQGDWAAVTEEIKAVKASCRGHVLKVIIEACQLTQEEKLAACRAVSAAGAAFIKTSTGFSSGGATEVDVALLRANVAPGVQVKAAGGIRSWEQAQAYLDLGAERLGTSALVRLAVEEDL